MPAKTFKFLPASSSKIKTFTASCLSVAALGVATLPSSALAYGAPTTERVVTVTFKASKLATAGGQADIYARLLESADAACKSDMKTLKYFNETVEECVADLMDQFIATANLETLAAYHRSQI